MTNSTQKYYLEKGVGQVAYLGATPGRTGKKKCMENERKSQHWMLILRELLLVGDQTCLRIVPSAHGESRALILHFFPECLCATD